MIYKQALETVEAFLEKRNIRNYCRTVCRGKCCQPYCKTQCKRPPLPCAMFLCDEMREFFFGFHNGEKYKRLRNEITGLVVYAGYPDIPEPQDVNVQIEIPDRLIDELINIHYEEDIHFRPKRLL